MADLFGNEAVATQPPDGEVGRVERCAFFTPDALALACAKALRLAGIEPHTILEPGCGGGAFLRAASETWPRAALLGVDILPACKGPGTVRRQDLFDPQLRGQFDLSLGNPPYDDAEAFVRRSIDLVREGGHAAFLLRISFLSSQGRVPLYREHPLSYFWPIAGRPSFTGGGSDTSEYGLFAWRKGARLPGRIMGPLEWKR